MDKSPEVASGLNPNGEFAPSMARYREASRPHESPEAGAAAVAEFLSELAELRVKYAIRDLYVIFHVSLIDPSGAENISGGTAGFGAQEVFESMTARAFGVERARRDARIREAVRGGTVSDEIGESEAAAEPSKTE